MLTVIAEIRTRPGQHHRQAVLDQFAKIIPTVLQEEVAMAMRRGLTMPQASVSRQPHRTPSSWWKTGKAWRT
jgi:hypothetical protein